MGRFVSVAFALICFLTVRDAFATKYYIAANGTDTNNGTSKSTPWLHAPGMANCVNTCAGVTPAAGDSFIFRGGDTWHFGNSGGSPYSGGTWTWSTSGTATNCAYEGSSTSCIYIGVDQTWFNSSTCGASWCRPILNADNPLSSTTVSSCAYQVGTLNTIFIMDGSYITFDNFEMTGLCQKDSPACCDRDQYITEDNGFNFNQYSNIYIHGWSSIAGVSYGCTAINGAAGKSTIGPSFIVDGSDSYAPACGALTGTGYRIVKSVFRYTTQAEGGVCHDIHDSIFEHFYAGIDGAAHYNMMECNTDDAEASPNVFYNNIFRHNDSSFGSQVHIWFCPNNTAAEYWFNNLVYDLTGGNYWDVDSSCGQSAGQFMFNNTLEMVNSGTGAACGAKLNPSNNLYIASVSNVYASGGSCPTTQSNDTHSITMLQSASNSQGYTSSSVTGTSPTSGGTCANDTTPCAPTALTNSTAGAGLNRQSYCTTLASYSSDVSIGTDAANACKLAIISACTYVTSNHTMSCPAQTATTRPTSGAWDVGAYQYSATSAAPNPPTGLTATVH